MTEPMRYLCVGVALGGVIGAVSATLVAQRSADGYPDAVTADPKHYRVAFENDVARRAEIARFDAKKAQHLLRRRPEIEDVPGRLDFVIALVECDVESDAVRGQRSGHAARPRADHRDATSPANWGAHGAPLIPRLSAAAGHSGPTCRGP